jgi:threonine/homoserine/homoserine lactone efflux protein
LRDRPIVPGVLAESGPGTVLAGVVFGLALAAPPGPMNAVIAEESVVRGWRAGFTAGLGAMTADALFFLLSLAGVVALLQRAPAVRTAMIGVGGLVMLYFAAGAVRELQRSFTEREADSSAVPAEARGFTKAFVLAVTNPYQILFWLTVGVALLEPGTVDVLAVLPLVGADLAGVFVVRTGSPALLSGLFLGIAVWIVGFPATLVRARRRIDALAPVVAGLSAVVLAAFGVAFCWTAFSTTLRVLPAAL